MVVMAVVSVSYTLVVQLYAHVISVVISLFSSITVLRTTVLSADTLTCFCCLLKIKILVQAFHYYYVDFCD